MKGKRKMPTCLGIYIDKHIIKYAKISKNKDSIKVDAFGIKTYSNLKQTIDQIISETFSFKIPISVNINEEIYNYMYMSNLLNKKDLNKAIMTEFESDCHEKGLNPHGLDSKYALVNDANEKERIKVIHISIDKIKINKIMQDFEGERISTISPISLSIANIVPLNLKENIAIVNIEDITTITLVTGQKVYEVKKINIGAEQILDSIDAKENSYQKAYEICKNTTIYTMEGKNLQEKESEYLEDIVPTLYKIANEVNETISNSLIKINKVYITGTASAINNIDLYFEELLTKTKCEILKPFFIQDSLKINIKDYVEVNSAIALALQGLDYGIKDLNFSTQKGSGAKWLSMEKKSSDNSNDGFLKKFNNINISNSKISKILLRVFSMSLIVFLGYTGLSLFINNEILNKQKAVEKVITNSNTQIGLIQKDITSVNSKATEYTTLTQNLEDATNQITEKNSYKNVIPVLLSEIMVDIPKEVKLTSIENPSDKKIVINAQSSKYEQLSYFKAILKSKGILSPTTVMSSEAVKDGETVKVVIEGELP